MIHEYFLLDDCLQNELSLLYSICWHLPRDARLDSATNKPYFDINNKHTNKFYSNNFIDFIITYNMILYTSNVVSFL